MAIAPFRRLLRKYSVVIFFPVFTATTIYADYSHTQNWKKLKAQSS